MDLIDLREKLVYDNLGFRYVLTVIDTFSKHAWAQPLKSKEGLEVVQTFEEILTFGTPHLLQSDNGREFKNQWMNEIANNYNIKQIFSLLYRPQSQGCIERFNQTLKRMLFAHMTRYRTKVWADVLQT